MIFFYRNDVLAIYINQWFTQWKIISIIKLIWSNLVSIYAFLRQYVNPVVWIAQRSYFNIICVAITILRMGGSAVECTISKATGSEIPLFMFNSHNPKFTSGILQIKGDQLVDTLSCWSKYLAIFCLSLRRCILSINIKITGAIFLSFFLCKGKLNIL